MAEESHIALYSSDGLSIYIGEQELRELPLLADMHLELRIAAYPIPQDRWAHLFEVALPYAVAAAAADLDGYALPEATAECDPREVLRYFGVPEERLAGLRTLREMHAELRHLRDYRRASEALTLAALDALAG